MVSTSEGVVYYCTVFLTAIVFLTEASAIATNYEKSTTQNKTNESPEITPQRTKLAPTRSRGNLSKNQNHDRVSPLTLNKLKTANTRLESVPQSKSERELLLVSNSGGENNVKDKGGGNTDDEDQKTLSQQVADGKYGLIQHEIFTSKPARPGVISYDVNPEVPKDNINNLGGLEPDDIWLAENHLLVLAGSRLSSMQSQWRPIDNYEAPKRQVQIPPNPKVPPPFPVQLSENGPIEYVHSDSSQPALPLTPFFNPLLTQYQTPNNTQGQPLYGKLPFGPLLDPTYTQMKPSLPINFNRPLPPQMYVKPPPGAEFIPPYLGNVNTSDAIDEDDPSLYYPPPYNFYYPKDNTTKVPPGPLVPGIVLPPPPDFFTLWSNNSASKEVSKLTVVKEKSRKQNNVFKLGKQLHYPVPSVVSSKPENTGPIEPPPKYITFDDIINEVTYPDTYDNKITYADVKVNKVSTEEQTDDWIPIPAPKPFYITGEKKPSKNTVLVVMEPPESYGYSYERPPTPLKIATAPSPRRPLLKYLQYVDKSNEQYVTTTPISPQLVSTRLSKQDNAYTTTPLSSYQPPNTIKATYYFYEEPKFDNAGKTKSALTSTSPALPVAPVTDYNDYLLPKPINNFQSVKSILNDPSKPVVREPQQEKKRKPITPMIPIYYLAELENLFNLVKPMSLPTYPTTQPTPSPQFYTTTVKPTYTINKPTGYERPTPKPISEYNYIAADYNPPANQIPHSTPLPIGYDSGASPQYSNDYNAHYHSPEYQPQIYNPLPQYNKPIQTSVNPILYMNPFVQQNTPPYTSFDQPWLPNLGLYNQFTYTTENPYYAFFTKEEEDLIDENTKKYFTIFGQKIKPNEEATSPLSVKTSAPPTTASPWRSTKYSFSSSSNIVPSSTPYPSQSSPSNYYSSTTPYSAEYTSINSHRRPPPSLMVPAISKYKEISSNVDSSSKSAGGSSSNTNRPLSLEGDTIVNYVTPLSEDNPDAEYITPKISKHIRPIVVEDLPADVNERLKNFMNLQKSKRTQNRASGKTRYVLIDNEYDNSNNNNNHYYINHQRYQPQNVIGSFNGKYDKQPTYEKSFSHHAESSAKPISLKSDIRVNYRSKVTKNPDAEYVATSSEQRSNPDENAGFSDEDDNNSGSGAAKNKKSRNTLKPISLKNDILVNYKHEGHYTTDADAEYIGSGAMQQPVMPSHGAGGRGSSVGSSSSSNDNNNVVSFKYPDIDHGHFYFLTPQEAHLTQIEDERYDFQSNVEKPSSYFKRGPRDFEVTTQKSEKLR